MPKRSIVSTLLAQVIPINRTWRNPLRGGFATTMFVAVSLVGASVDVEPALAQSVDCDNIRPSATAATNRTAIQACLDTAPHRALLAAGTFNLDNSLRLNRRNSLLSRAAGVSTWPRLELLSSTSQHAVRLDGAGSRVSFVVIDANGKLGLGGASTPAAVLLHADNTQLLHSHVVGATQRATAAVYITCTGCTGVWAGYNQLHGNFHGVVINTNRNTKNNNRVTNNQIYDNTCDAVTLREGAYARVAANNIHDNGWDCENGPIPGGGIYSAGNTFGALIENNTISNTCGHGIDLFSISNFKIRGNKISLPGNTALSPVCHGHGMALLDIRESVIEKNVVTNHRSSNRVGNFNFGDANGLFRATGAGSFSDLPHGSNNAIAFVLAERANPSVLTNHNVIRDNVFRSSCSSPCVGMGFFTSRGTGFGANKSWSAATTNYFTGNKVSGSQYGSRRGGGNWYAASSVCTSGSPPPCNDDDFQHNPPKGNWARNDNFYHY